MPEMMQRSSKRPSGSALWKTGKWTSPRLDELDLHRHADRDLLGRAVDDVRQQPHACLLLERDDRDHVGYLEPGGPLRRLIVKL